MSRTIDENYEEKLGKGPYVPKTAYQKAKEENLKRQSKKSLPLRIRLINFLKSQGYDVGPISLIGRKRKLKRLNTFEKDDLLNAIRNYWTMNPDLRLCQLLGNIIGQKDFYYYEDRELLNILKKKVGK
jgi:hypothetical protein